MQLSARVAEGHGPWRKQRLMGNVVPALRLVGNGVLVHPKGRLGLIVAFPRPRPHPEEAAGG